MSAADNRIAELLDRWLASVELHARYLQLDDEAYAKVQDWPPHQRPTRWIIELARTRLGELRQEVTRRTTDGDAEFANALELMGFLTCLLGTEQVDRFIPLARAPTARKAAVECAPPGNPRRPSGEVQPPAAKSMGPAAAQPAPSKRAVPAKAGPREAVPTRPAAIGRQQARATPTAPPRKQARAKTTARPATPRQESAPVKPEVAAKVINDAVRLLNWGNEWPQLAGLVARLADRPPESEVWRILRENRAAIEAKAGQSRH